MSIYNIRIIYLYIIYPSYVSYNIISGMRNRPVWTVRDSNRKEEVEGRGPKTVGNRVVIIS